MLGRLTLARMTPDLVAAARDELVTTAYKRGGEKTNDNGNKVLPEEYQRSGAIVDRY